MTILHVIKNIWDSWLEVKRSTLITVWKKLIPTLMGESETFKDFSKESVLEMESIPSEYTVKIIETTKDWEYY